MYKVTKERNNV